MSTKRIFFAILLLGVIAITTKAMHSAATSDGSITHHTAAKARAMVRWGVGLFLILRSRTASIHTLDRQSNVLSHTTVLTTDYCNTLRHVPDTLFWPRITFLSTLSTLPSARRFFAQRTTTPFLRIRDTTQAAAKPLVLGMEEPWGEGSWGYPKAEERSIKTSLENLHGPSGPLSTVASAADEESLNKAKYFERLRASLSQLFTCGGVRLRRQERRT